MGYYMDQVHSDFMIKKENFDVALKALKDVFVEKNMTCCDSLWEDGKRIYHPHFAWVDTERVLKSENLINALNEIRWEPDTNDDGNIDYIEFNGEKIGDEDIFFNAIAPYVKDGSYIEMVGEDNYRWRWVFHDGMVEEKAAKIIWD